MVGNITLAAGIAGFVLAVTAAASQAAPPAQAGPANASKQVQSRDQAKEQSRDQVQEQTGNPQADPGREMKGNQGQNTSQEAGPEVRNGPYGDKQNAKKSGSGGGK